MNLPKRKSKTLPKNFGSPLHVVAATIAIFLLTQILAAVIVGTIFAMIHTDSSSLDLLEESAPAQFIYILLAEGGAAGFVFYILKRRGLKRSHIGLGRRPVVKDLAKGLLGFLAFFAILIVINSILSAFFPELNSEKQDVGFDALNSSLDWIIALCALVLIPPIGEEILVRGYLFSGLRSKLKYVPAMLITSLLFGMAHLQLGSSSAVLWAAGIDTFILSIVLVHLREKTGALYAGMLVHALNNLIAFGVHFR